jgi:hypothetical protein
MAAGIECRREPAALLVPKKPKLVAKKKRRYVKDLVAYDRVRRNLIAGWQKLIPAQCGEGARFLTELRARLT